MKSYLTDLELTSPTLSLAEITALVGHPPGPTSNDLGERDPRGRRRKHSTWRLSSAVSDDVSLEEHLSELREQAEELGLLDSHELPADLHRILTVAVMHETVTCTVHLPAAALLPFLAGGFDLEVSAYPVDEAPPE